MNKKKVEEFVRRLITEGLGFDLTDPNLRDTPNRIARMYCDEFFCNEGCEFSGLSSFPNEEGYDQIVLHDLIHFTSICSHHFLPFSGHAWFLYIPNKRLVGASKPSRLIDHYSRRPQLQENIGHQAMRAFEAEVEPQGTMIVMRCIHGCMKCRGIKQNRAGLTTSVISGAFKKPDVKQEGWNMINLSLKDG